MTEMGVGVERRNEYKDDDKEEEKTIKHDDRRGRET